MLSELFTIIKCDFFNPARVEINEFIAPLFIDFFSILIFNCSIIVTAGLYKKGSLQ
jgi:hypothetical protein